MVGSDGPRPARPDCVEVRDEDQVRAVESDMGADVQRRGEVIAVALEQAVGERPLRAEAAGEPRRRRPWARWRRGGRAG